MQEENKLFVGNLPFSLNNDSLRDTFAAVEGVEVVEAAVITDKFSGKSRGFGFVTVANNEMAQKAIDALNGKEVEGREITVNIARPKTEGGNRDRNFGRPRY